MNLLQAWLSLLQAAIAKPGALALGWTLVHSLWEGALVALVLAAVLRTVRSSQARYAAGCVALVVLAAGFAVTFARQMPPGPPHGTIHASTGRIPGLPAGDLGREPDDWTPSGSLGYLPWLAPVWLAGVLGFQLRGLAAWISARRLRGTGVCAAPGTWTRRLDQLAQRARLSKRVMLLESCLAEVPVVIGYLRPAILLPVGLLAGLPAAQVEAILLHELAHIRRHDYLVNLVQMFVEGLLFYHPAVWWISASIRAERENCCDDVVVATQGDAYGYAAALAALEERRAVSGDAVLAANGGSLVKRIRRLLAPPEGPRAGLSPVLSAVLLTVTLVGAIALWQTAPASAAPQSATTVAAPQATPAARRAVTGQVAQVQAPVRKKGPAAEAQPDATLATPYRKWLNEDVAYIITDEERSAFKRLETELQREEFIEHFWLVRDPTPGTAENEFREEHYRRIGYANEHFSTAAGLPGWKTDRGRIYITFGPPDEIDSHPAGGSYQRPAEQGGATTSTFPFEQWRYRFIENVGQNVIIEFVDSAMTGEYRMTADPSEKDVLRAATARQATEFQPIPASQGGGRGSANLAKAGTTVSVVGNNGVQMSIPLDRYGDHQVNLYVRLTNSEGRVVKVFEQLVHGQMTFSQFLALTPGSYRLHVALKDIIDGTAAGDSIAFEVK